MTCEKVKEIVDQIQTLMNDIATHTWSPSAKLCDPNLPAAGEDEICGIANWFSKGIFESDDSHFSKRLRDLIEVFKREQASCVPLTCQLIQSRLADVDSLVQAVHNNSVIDTVHGFCGAQWSDVGLADGWLNSPYDHNRFCSVALGAANNYGLTFLDPTDREQKTLASIEKLRQSYQADMVQCAASSAAIQSTSGESVRPDTGAGPVVAGGATRVYYTSNSAAAGENRSNPGDSSHSRVGPQQTVSPTAPAEPLNVVFDTTGAESPFRAALDSMKSDQMFDSDDETPASILGTTVISLKDSADRIAAAQPTAEAKRAQTLINQVMVPLPEKLDRCLARGDCDPDVDVGGIAYRLLPGFIRQQVARGEATVRDARWVLQEVKKAGPAFTKLNDELGCFLYGFCAGSR